jgi:DNA-binding MarR family transcriptional regulator
VGSTSRPSRLEHYVGYLLRRAYVRAERAATIAVPAPYGMRHLWILALLQEHGPMSQRALAALTQVNRTIMVQLIDVLEDDGLVRRERNPDDRRSYALTPTPKGAAALRRLAPAMDQAEELLTANLSASERIRLAELLSGFVDAGVVDAGVVDAGFVNAGVVANGSCCGYLITHAHHTLRGEGTDRMAPLGLDPRHLAALESIDRNQPCSQEMVANDLAVSAPVVVDLVDDLVAAGFVERRRNSDDRRRYDLTVTGVGRTRLRAGLKVLGDIDDELRVRLTPGGADELRKLLTALIDVPLSAA